MKLFYLYEIYIENKASVLNQCYYYGKHEIDNTKKDTYFGSGKLIKRYIRKYGISGLTKTILSYYENSKSLCLAEKELIESKKLELGARCLNIAEGGTGSWKHVNDTLTAEQRHSNALAGGLSNKKRLEDPEQLELWRQAVTNRHANMTVEEKSAIYTKSSASLKAFYASDEGKQLILDNLQRNSDTNKKTAQEWRSDFNSLFEHTPEYYRKFKLLKVACDYYKEIKNKEDRVQLAKKFNEQLEFIKPATWTCADIDTRNDKLKQIQIEKHRHNDKNEYLIDSILFLSQFELLSYLNIVYFKECQHKLSKGVLAKICEEQKVDSRVRLEIKEICNEIIKKLVIRKKEL